MNSMFQLQEAKFIEHKMLFVCWTVLSVSYPVHECIGK